MRASPHLFMAPARHQLFWPRTNGGRARFGDGGDEPEPRIAQPQYPADRETSRCPPGGGTPPQAAAPAPSTGVGGLHLGLVVRRLERSGGELLAGARFPLADA